MPSSPFASHHHGPVEASHIIALNNGTQRLERYCWGKAGRICHDTLGFKGLDIRSRPLTFQLGAARLISVCARLVACRVRRRRSRRHDRAKGEWVTAQHATAWTLISGPRRVTLSSGLSHIELRTWSPQRPAPFHNGGQLARARFRLDLLKLPIVCAIHLTYCHARLDRAPDHVFRSPAARKRHDQIGFAFVEHPLIAQWRR
jgi:hypothetical protein